MKYVHEQLDNFWHHSVEKKIGGTDTGQVATGKVIFCSNVCDVLSKSLDQMTLVVSFEVLPFTDCLLNIIIN